jgi:hypothetical protein
MPSTSKGDAAVLRRDSLLQDSGRCPHSRKQEPTSGTLSSSPDSAHEEFSLLVEADLTPAQALKAARMGPARALDMPDSRGSIAPSQLAHLVLLAANPLEDIRNRRRIEAVVLNGRYLDRTALDALLGNAVSPEP